MVWLKPRIEVWAPILTASPRVIVPRNTTKGFAVQLRPVRRVPVT